MAIITNSVAKDNTNLEDQHKVITLDLDTRKFDGPNNYVVAIKGDSNSQKLTFVTPMEYDGVDLFGTTCVLTYWTSWTNDEGIHSKGEITLIPEEFENKLKYTWVLDPNQTAKAGEVRFKIGFYLNLDDDFY